MKYYVFFHLINSLNVRMPITLTPDEFETQPDRIANALLKCPFTHFMDDKGRLIIVNMSNVAYIKIVKAEGDDD